MSIKSCFVAMPIKEQTEEYTHFEQVYRTLFAPPLSALGYSIRRGDEVKRGGSITDHIIRDLASSDIVIADLTGFNPNVWYELGIRHSLRKFGTILVIDETQLVGDRIPFNLKGQRILSYNGYKPTLNGANVFHALLTARISEIAPGQPDNIVHETLPQLPDDLAVPIDERQRNLIDAMEVLENKLRVYRVRFGEISENETVTSPLLTARERILQISLAAKSGRDPSSLVAQCIEAASNENLSNFVEALDKIGALRQMKPNSRQYLEIITAADQVFENYELTFAVIELARETHPEDKQLLFLWLAQLRKGSQDDRQRALTEIEALIGFDRSKGLFTVSDLAGKQIELKLYFDALLKENELSVAIAVCDEIEKQHGRSALIARERARAIEARDGESMALNAYKEAALLPDADDTSAIWYGNTLNNLRRYREAAEAYLLACIRDPSDANGFSHSAQSLGREYRLGRSNQSLPNGVGEDEVRALIVSALACEPSSDEKRRLQEAADSFSLDFSSVSSDEEQISRMTVRKRIELAEAIYATLKSEATTLDVVH
jgi:tetratricopeptide (TPR) repeat protein